MFTDMYLSARTCQVQGRRTYRRGRLLLVLVCRVLQEPQSWEQARIRYHASFLSLSVTFLFTGEVRYRQTGQKHNYVMKKTFFAALALLIAGTAMAGDHKHSIGLTVGSLNGISYKYYFSDKFALQNDLVAGFQATAAGMSVSLKVKGESAEKDSGPLEHATVSTVEFVYNPNALYHLSLGNTGLNMAFGGGISIGFGKPYRYDYRYSGEHMVLSGADMWPTNHETGASKTAGKFGVNAFAGIEYQMPNSPVVFAFDFRPGYGVLFASERNDKDSDVKWKATYCLNTFDWRLSLSMRYCF